MAYAIVVTYDEYNQKKPVQFLRHQKLINWDIVIPDTPIHSSARSFNISS
jgi:hypothetical protein